MTQNQSADAELKRYKLAIQGSNICIWDWMDITEKEQWWSHRFYDMLGYKEGEIEASIDTFRELLHPQDEKRVMGALNNHLETGESMTLEYRMDTKSSGYKWFESSGKVEFDADGNPRRMVGNVVDIDDRKQAELQVDDERQMLRTIIDNIPANVYVKNRDGEKVLANKSEYELWGFDSEDEIIGKTDAELSRDGVAVLSQNEDRYVLESGKPIIEKDAYTEIKGEEYVLLVSKIPLTNSKGQVTGLVGISTDITERKQMEEQLRQRNQQLKKLNETTSKIYSVIGHDLKTPLASILGVTDLMLADIDASNENAVKAENLKIIHQASLKMSDLLKDLLNWAHLQTGDLSLKRESFVINDAIRDTIDLLEISADQKDIAIQFSSEKSLTVDADKQLIATIVRNFISNAIKFSNEGDAITVTLSSNEQQWQLSVKDQGVGMSEATQEKLFDDEDHPSSHGTNNEKGSGIGLRLCKQLANMHDGHIKVESAPDQGSTFTLVMPRS